MPPSNKQNINEGIMFPLSFNGLNGSFQYDPSKTLEEQKQFALSFFNNPSPFDDELTQQLINAGTSRYTFKSTARGEADRQMAKQLSEQARKIIVDTSLDLKKYTAEHDESIALKRLVIFYRLDGSDESNQFNDALTKAAQEGNAEERSRLMYQEIERCREIAGINTIQDVTKIYELDDSQLLQRYEGIRRYARFITEAHQLDLILSPEEEQKFQELVPHLQDMSYYIESKLNIIANPCYEQIDPTRFFKKDTGANSTKIKDVLDDTDLEGLGIDDTRDPMHQPLVNFFEQIEAVNSAIGTSVMDRAQLAHPELKGATFDAKNAGMSLMNFRPVPVRTTDGRDMVVTTGAPPKVQTGQEFTKDLSQLATRVDRWLLTGSKEFATMKRAMKSLNEEFGKGNSLDELESKNDALLKAAEDYLRYKGIKATPISAEDIVNKGKNQREQNRLDAALDIYYYAQNQKTALEKVREKEQAAAKSQAEPEPPKQEQPQQEQIRQAEPKPEVKALEAHDPARIEGFFANMEKAMTAQMKVSEGAKFAPTREEYALLATLACADRELSIKTKVGNAETGRIYNDPDVTYPQLMEGKLFQNQSKGISTANAFADKAQRSLNEALKSVEEKGDYQQLGKILADGLKQNNKMLQEQKGLTDQFTAYAQFGGKVLDMMARNPKLAEAAGKHLTPADRQAAEAAAAISSLRVKGLQSRDALTQRFENGQASEADAADMANLCQLCGVAKQMGAGKLDLAASPYGLDKNMAENFNKALGNNELLKGFLDKKPEEKAALIKNTEEMAKMYQQGIQAQTGMAKNGDGNEVKPIFIENEGIVNQNTGPVAPVVPGGPN